MIYLLVGCFMVVVAVILLGALWLVRQTVTTVNADRQEFFAKLAVDQAGARAEREAQQEHYERLMDLQAEREQMLAEVDKEWIASPESEVHIDDDLQWEEDDGVL